jgi:hypothetical protein
MKRPLKAKLIAAAILIVIIVALSNFFRARDQQMGRDAFLARQAKRYDTVLTHPSWSSEIAGAVRIYGILFTAYELLVIGLSRFVSDDPVSDQNT